MDDAPPAHGTDRPTASALGKSAAGTARQACGRVERVFLRSFEHPCLRRAGDLEADRDAGATIIGEEVRCFACMPRTHARRPARTCGRIPLPAPPRSLNGGCMRLVVMLLLLLLLVVLASCRKSSSSSSSSKCPRSKGRARASPRLRPRKLEPRRGTHPLPFGVRASTRVHDDRLQSDAHSRTPRCCTEQLSALRAKRCESLAWV